MGRNPVRRFHIVDAIALIAATAAGLALTRRWGILGVIHEKILTKYFPDGILRPPDDGNLSDLGGYFLAPWSLALVAVRLYVPRASRGRLLTKPGFVATGTASIFMILRLAQFTVEDALLFGGDLHEFSLVHSVTEASPVAIAVITAWTLMAALGRWRAEASWIDRAGRAVGVAWVAMALMDWFRWPIY
jgi:hypothetical protein